MISIRISENYPRDLSDDNLDSFLKELNIALSLEVNPINLQKYTYVLMVGLNEFQNRLNKKSEQKAKKYTVLSILFTVIAVTLSAISVYYSNKDDIADTIWMQKQIEEYQQMNKSLLKINNQLEKSIIYNYKKDSTYKQQSINNKKSK